jgi:small nuclear ribonucleoprotein (snRNP)-like protein
MSPRDPISTLGDSLNKTILVKCKRQKVFEGILRSFDAHLNVLLENVKYTYSEPKEIKDDEKSEDEDDIPRIYEEKKEKIDKLILRGDSIVFIGLAPKSP